MSKTFRKYGKKKHSSLQSTRFHQSSMICGDDSYSDKYSQIIEKINYKKSSFIY